MERLTTPDGTTLSYERSGSGPALVLVHGAFSDSASNWDLVRPALAERFTLYAIDRRGRGETTATEGHRLADEAADVAALIAALGEPVFLLGHSYGAHCALVAALLVPDRIRKLVLYEAAYPDLLTSEAMARLEPLAAADAWDDFATTFFRDLLCVPAPEVEALRASELWPAIVTDAKASLRDLRALRAYRFDAERWSGLDVPVLLQIGTESPRHFYVSDALAAVLPDARIGELAGQAHEAMTTAPDLYARAVTDFLLGSREAARGPRVTAP